MTVDGYVEGFLVIDCIEVSFFLELEGGVNGACGIKGVINFF